MRIIDIRLGEELDEVEIVPFWDLHIGSPKCKYDEIQSRISYVQNVANAYAIIGGDLCNNSTRDSVGDTYTEQLTPMEQIKMAVELFRPISDKILGICSGNHERRSYKKEGVDLDYFFASELGLADKYDYTAGLIFLQFGLQKRTASCHKARPQLYTIYFTHGDGQGGRTIGGKVAGLQRRGDMIDADVIITGHTHQPFSTRQCKFRINPPTRSISKVDQLLVNTDATIEYEQYAEIMGLPPSSTFNPRIMLCGPEHLARAIV